MHAHSRRTVRRQERKYSPDEHEYVVFLGQFPVDKFLYCTRGECKKPSKSTLFGKLALPLGLYDKDKKLMLESFSRKYWVLDLLTHKRPLSEITEGQIARQLAFLVRMMFEETGRLPKAIVPAMSNNPKSQDEVDQARSFGARVYRAVQSDKRLRKRFEVIFLTPWDPDYASRIEDLNL